MKALGNIDMSQNLLKNIVLESVVNFPTVSKAGQVIFKDKRVMMCVEIDGGIPLWAPLTNELNTHVHSQSLASTTWTINHALETASAMVQVLDTSNNHIIADNIVQTYNQTVITFTNAQAGKAILQLGNTEGHPRANIAHEQVFNTPSTTWVVTHGLGYNPITRVFIGNSEVQPLSVAHDTVNQTTVTFTNPQTGTVRCI
jgi:hypothetical protein